VLIFLYHDTAQEAVAHPKSEKLGNAVRDGANPSSIDGNRKPDARMWPSNPQGFTCFRNH
jgi:hypothetical protein